MAPKFHTPHALRAFDAIAHRVQAHLTTHHRGAFGYSADTIAARLAQRVVELALNPFVTACVDRIEQGRAPIPETHESASWGGLRFKLQSGAVGATAGLIVRSLGEFAVHWALLLWHAVIGGFRRQGKDPRSATLIFGIGAEGLQEEGSDARFAAYCRSGPIQPLVSADRLIVQSLVPIRSSDPTRLQYGRFPLINAARTIPLGVRGRIRLVLCQTLMLVRFCAAVIRRPLLATLARDAAEIELVRAFDRSQRLNAVVITNSAYARQPLWMRERERRRFETHMIWYSQNIMPFVFRADGLRSDLPNYRHLLVDTHWLWTSACADYLCRLGVTGELHACGPILWYLSKPAQPRADNEIRIVVFDVTPLREDFTRRIGLIYNYYATANMIRFIEEIAAAGRELQASTGRRVRLLLKHKRSYHALHDRRYIEFIERLTGPEGAFELVPFGTNIYALLAGSDLSIVAPYSSPAYVADHVGKPAIYFDATTELEPTFDATPWVHFAGDRAQLLATAHQLLGRRRDNAVARG